MTKQTVQKAAETLRKAVPLMIKNQVPTTPPNYALWYTYVEKTQPKLNKEIDRIISEHGICLPSHNENLYQSYIANKNDADIKDLKSNLEILINEIFVSMKDTITDTTNFEKSLEQNVSSLEKIDNDGITFEELMTLARSFVTEAQAIKNSTQYLNKRLNTASHEISELRQQLEQVQKDALHDSLSGLLNRGAFDKDLDAYCRKERSEPLCLILVDIDDFKSLNDQYGHVFGDMVIKAIARRFLNNRRDGIEAYRYGGEEFALLVPNKTVQNAKRFAETVRCSIEKISIKDKRTGEQVSNISASFGVAEFEQGTSAISLIDSADQQLYKAKNLGKNRVMPV